MSFFVSDNLKNVITEEDLVENFNKDMYLCLESDYFKKEYFIRNYKNDFGAQTFNIETSKDIVALFKANNTSVKHAVLVSDNYVLRGEGILEIKEFNQSLEENLISCKIVIKQRGTQW